MPVLILYFASVRDHIGFASEEHSLPETIVTLGALADWLSAQSPGHARAFQDRTRLRAALDQEMADLQTPIGEAREIAFFPPVTGG